MQIMRPAQRMVGPRKRPAVERIAQGELDVVLAAAVAHRGDAALQRIAHQLHAAHGDLGCAHAVLDRARIALGAAQRMDVAVDDAGDQRAARRVDLVAGEACELGRGGDALDLAVLLQHRLPVQNLLAVEYDDRRHTTWPLTHPWS
jgi:hypothetical protein